MSTINEKPAVDAAGGDGNLSGAANLAQLHGTTPHPRMQAPRLRHGRLYGDTWVKSARASVHMLRRPPAWCLDQGDARAAWQLGALYVVIQDTETGEQYWTRLSDVLQRAALIDRGAGPQLLWPLAYWAPTRADLEPEPLQPALGGVL